VSSPPLSTLSIMTAIPIMLAIFVELLDNTAEDDWYLSSSRRDS
jgi:hypothetical protein